MAVADTPGRGTTVTVTLPVHATNTPDAGIDASPDEPQYLVQSDRSGGMAVHKPSALRRDGRRP